MKIVVLGGGYAGLTAAARLAEAGLAPTLVDAKDEFVERIRLHEVAAGSTPRPLPYAPFLAARGGTFCRARVVAIDADRRSLRLADGDPVTYDMLVYAVGSATKRPAHSIGLDSIVDARAALPAEGGALLIVGGGLTGIESAAEFAERRPDISVTLATGSGLRASDAPGGISRAGIAHVRDVLERLRVTILDDAWVETLGHGRATFRDGRSIAFATCVWAAGFAPSALAHDAGIAVTKSGKVITDHTLRSVSHPEIVAIGDCAEAIADPGGPCRMSCAVGRPMGQAAADAVRALAGGAAPGPFAFGYAFRCMSLGRADGLIQFVDAQDRPTTDIWTGARAARWKEYICRRTLNGIGLDPDLGPAPDTPPRQHVAAR
jgi:NADH dehydrogenase FAD-containing subunit